MATETAPSMASTEPAQRRQFWQLPTFVLGLTLAVLAWKYFPARPATTGADTARQQAELRQALEKRSIDVTELEQVLRRLPSNPDEITSPQLHHMMGSANLILAERGLVGESADRWQRAFVHLSRCDATVLTDPITRSTYAFRTAKASAATGVGDPAQLIQALDSVPPSEDPGERTRLIADTCLRMTPPDLKRAKAELSTYLSGQARGTVGHLAKYRLKLSELCMASNEPDKARAWLKEIGPDAPPESVSAAKMQLARIAFSERDTNEAVKMLQSAEQVPGLPDEQKAVIRFETARGLLGLGNTTAAREYFLKLTNERGPIGVATRVKLAELIAREPVPKGAVEHLEAATKGLNQPADFTNSYITLAELRGAFEAAISACRSGGDYESALRCTAPYRPVAEDNRDRFLWCEIQANWGEAQLQAGQSVDGKSRLTQASAEMIKLADMSHSAAARANHLNQASDWYRLAGDKAGEAAVLNSLATLPGASVDVAAAANVSRADQFLAEGRFDEAVKLLNQATQSVGAVGTRAKVKLALAYTTEGKRRMLTKATDPEARKLLENGQDLLADVANKTYETADEKLAHQEALYELGRLLVSPNLPGILNYQEADTRFGRLLREYPTGHYTEWGTLYRGICLTQLANGEHNGRVAPTDAERKLSEAKSLFDGLTKAKNEKVRVHADMRLMYTVWLLKQYDTLPTLCEQMVTRYKGRVQELIALNMLYSGFMSARRPDQAKLVYDRLDQAYRALPETAFSNEMTEYTKAHWSKWLADQRP
jgi:tetratricopeptide (TPR) repeat protein